MNAKHNILLAEDDEMFGNLLKDYLGLNGFQVTLCRDGAVALEQFRESDYDMIITDVMMPVKDGFTLVSELKRINRIIPVIYLTARNQKEDIIKGYKTGADDYITKPFDSEVLLHKIQAVLMRSDGKHRSDTSGLTFGQYSFDYASRSLLYGNQSERLSPREAELLILLLNRKGELVQRAEILVNVWGDDSYFNNRSLDVYITRLRKRLAQDPAVQIESLYGSGIRMLW